MKVEQFVMAYSAEQDRIRALLPEGVSSLRPVLRVNAEIWDDARAHLEFNTAVEKNGLRGWLNIAHWSDAPFERHGQTVLFTPAFLELSFTGTGIEGGCPAEADNAGCWFLGATETLRPPETITAHKEFCDCRFQWKYTSADAHGVSLGKTLPAVPQDVKNRYPKRPLTAPNAAAIACAQVLGCYRVTFERSV